MPSKHGRPDTPSVVVVGGGLAGMTAALALADRGLNVTLLESQRRLGGRVAPIDDTVAGRPIDFCPHVALGCCTNLLHLLRSIGAADRWRHFDRLHFFGPDGQRYNFAASRWLPAPLHLLPALWGLRYLPLADRWAIARALRRLAGADSDLQPPVSAAEGPSAAVNAQEQTIARWLIAQRQSPEAILRFWAVVLHNALGERLDSIELKAARKVFVDGFLAAWQAWHVYTPAASLWHDVCQPLAAALEQRGVCVRCGCRAVRVEGDSHQAAAVVLADGSRVQAQFVILAVPWHQAADLLAEPLRAALPQSGRWADIPACPIAAVHLWFDRPITALPNAVLTSECGWWLFNKGCWELTEQCGSMQREGNCCHYYQVVISAAYELAARSAEDVLATVFDVLRRHFPAAADAILLHWRALVHRRAVFGCRPGVGALRPSQRTVIPNLILAGDWTATGWPATMESAVRSGYAAAEAVLAALGKPERIVAGDLPRGRLAKWLLGDRPEPKA